MTFGLMKFLYDHQVLKTIEQKFCTPGHSSIQEEDNIHSHIEKALRLSEIYSPVSLIRIMSQVRPKSSKVIQLKKCNFFNFQQCMASLKFTKIPYTQIKHILYTSTKPIHVRFKTSFSENFEEVSLKGQLTRMNDCTNLSKILLSSKSKS